MDTPDRMVITALPDTGWQFDGWSGPVDDPSAATTFIIIEAGSIRVVALFSAIPDDNNPDDNDSGGSDSSTGCFLQMTEVRQ